MCTSCVDRVEGGKQCMTSCFEKGLGCDEGLLHLHLLLVYGVTQLCLVVALVLFLGFGVPTARCAYCSLCLLLGVPTGLRRQVPDHYRAGADVSGGGSATVCHALAIGPLVGHVSGFPTIPCFIAVHCSAKLGVEQGWAGNERRGGASNPSHQGLGKGAAQPSLQLARRRSRTSAGGWHGLAHPRL